MSNTARTSQWSSIQLGSSARSIPPLAMGTWSWGDKAFWNHGVDAGPSDLVETFLTCVEHGLTFFDTAEVYGHGESEKILGYMASRHETQVAIASKFALLPGRDGARALRPALMASLKRLRRTSIELYQLHWPDRQMATIEQLMDAMADVYQDGLIRAVGVSNCAAEEFLRAHDALAKRGIPLVANQVEFSLLQRSPLSNGVLAACRERDALLLAYSPLAQGLLAGRYFSNPPAARRGQSAMFAPDNVARAMRIHQTLKAISASHEGRPPAQIAVRWLMDQPGVVPIVGVRRKSQVEDFLGIADLILSDVERSLLDAWP